MPPKIHRPRRALRPKKIRGVYFTAIPKLTRRGHGTSFSVVFRQHPAKELFDVDPCDDEMLDTAAINRMRMMIDALDLLQFLPAKHVPMAVRNRYTRVEDSAEQKAVEDIHKFL